MLERARRRDSPGAVLLLVETRRPRRKGMEPVRGVEPRVNPYEGLVFPLHHTGMERVTGIEPALNAWKALVMPLDHTRIALPQRFELQLTG